MQHMPPHQQRVINELFELEEKLNNLRTFIQSNPIFNTLDATEQGRLIQQSEVMAKYSQILDERINAFVADII
jgi:hypothetical protein